MQKKSCPLIWYQVQLQCYWILVLGIGCQFQNRLIGRHLYLISISIQFFLLRKHIGAVGKSWIYIEEVLLNLPVFKASLYLVQNQRYLCFCDGKSDIYLRLQQYCKDLSLHHLKKYLTCDYKSAHISGSKHDRDQL